MGTENKGQGVKGNKEGKIGVRKKTYVLVIYIREEKIGKTPDKTLVWCNVTVLRTVYLSLNLTTRDFLLLFIVFWFLGCQALNLSLYCDIFLHIRL